MITPQYCQGMARYNTWQNNGLRSIVAAMDDAELQRDRGAFFGSIWATINHLLWGDVIWLHRLGEGSAPSVPASQHTALTADKSEWDRLRASTDARITQWAAALTQVRLDGDVTWRSVMNDVDMVNPYADCAVHFFNHQTHHRGQVHAMLTAAGQKPQATDLLFMPQE